MFNKKIFRIFRIKSDLNKIHIINRIIILKIIFRIKSDLNKIHIINRIIILKII